MFAISKKIPISDIESEIIYNFILNNYNDLLNNNIEVFNKLKGNIRDEVLTEVIALYNENKTKFI